MKWPADELQPALEKTAMELLKDGRGATLSAFQPMASRALGDRAGADEKLDAAGAMANAGRQGPQALAVWRTFEPGQFQGW
ncbi:MAG: hypothetical protein ACKV19_06395 [Verrucomicrobiales bacterium]